MSKNFDYNIIKQEFTNKGYNLLDTEIKSYDQKLNFVCDKGHNTTMVYRSFKYNKSRCKICCYNELKINRSFSQAYVEQYFKDHGCILLSKYENNHIPVLYQCSCGKESSIRFMSFRKGSRCYNCYLGKKSGEKNSNWRFDREEKAKEELFQYKARWPLQKCFRRKGKYSTTDITKLGYSSLELYWKLTSHKNWSSIRINKQKLTIDHIFPIIAFYDYGITDLKIINSLDNLRPLCNELNISKSKKYNHSEFIAWLATKGIKIKENQNELYKHLE